MQQKEANKGADEESNISLMQLPSEIILSIILFIKPSDRLSLALVCRLLNEIITVNDEVYWKQICEQEGISINQYGTKLAEPNYGICYRNMFRDRHLVLVNRFDTYYVVGQNIILTEPAPIYDMTHFPYVRVRDNFTKKELRDSFPNSAQVDVFLTLEDAKAYARHVSSSDGLSVSSCPAIFEVTMENDFKSCRKSKELKPTGLDIIRLINRTYQPIVHYITCDVKDLATIKSGWLSHFEMINFDFTETKSSRCVIS